MFKIRDLMVQGSMYISNILLSIEDGLLKIGEKKVACLSEDVAPMKPLALSHSGDLIHISNMSVLRIYVNSETGSDDNGYGNESHPFMTLSRAIEMANAMNMYNSLEIHLNGQFSMNSDKNLEFNSSVSIIGSDDGTTTISLANDQYGNSPTVFTGNSETVVISNIELIPILPSIEKSSIISGSPSRMLLDNVFVILKENYPLISSEGNVSIVSKGSTINNTDEPIVYNDGYSIVIFSADEESVISDTTESMIADLNTPTVGQSLFLSIA